MVTYKFKLQVWILCLCSDSYFYQNGHSCFGLFLCEIKDKLFWPWLTLKPLCVTLNASHHSTRSYEKLKEWCKAVVALLCECTRSGSCVIKCIRMEFWAVRCCVGLSPPHHSRRPLLHQGPRRGRVWNKGEKTFDCAEVFNDGTTVTSCDGIKKRKQITHWL